MAIDEKTLRDYYQLKKAQVLLHQRLDKLNKKIKEELEPGEHQTGKYKATLTLKRKYAYDYTQAFYLLDEDVIRQCSVHLLDPDLIESAYLRDLIDDNTMQLIRGEATIIPSLTVKESDDVQADL